MSISVQKSWGHSVHDDAAESPEGGLRRAGLGPDRQSGGQRSAACDEPETRCFPGRAANAWTSSSRLDSVRDAISVVSAQPSI